MGASTNGTVPATKPDETKNGINRELCPLIANSSSPRCGLNECKRLKLKKAVCINSHTNFVTVNLSYFYSTCEFPFDLIVYNMQMT